MLQHASTVSSSRASAFSIKRQTFTCRPHLTPHAATAARSCMHKCILGLTLQRLSASCNPQPPEPSRCVQLRVVTRLGIALTSTDFKAAEYYPNIRKAIVAGYFMQARTQHRPQFLCSQLLSAAQCACTSLHSVCLCSHPASYDLHHGDRSTCKTPAKRAGAACSCWCQTACVQSVWLSSH